MAASQDEQAEAESRFILNLKRLSGRYTNSVTPEHILEFLVHLHQSNVEELQFIEEEYTSVVFENDEFINTYLKIYSVEVLIQRYASAKKENDTDFLTAFRSIHRRARDQVLTDETKQIIREFIKRRKAQNEMKLIGAIVSNSQEYLTRFQRPSITSLLIRMLPHLAAEQNLSEIMMAT